MTLPTPLDDTPTQLYVKAFLETPDKALSKVDLFRLIWNARLLAIIGLSIGALAGFIGASFMQPVYRSQLIVEYVDRSSGGGDAALGGALGGIASLAGISVGESSGRAYALGRVKSQQLLLDYIRASNAKSILFASRWDQKSATFNKDADGRTPTDLQAVARFKKSVMRFDEDPLTRLISVQVDWSNPKQSAKWGNEYISYVDRVLREEKLIETQQSLIFLRRELETTQLPEIRAAVARLIQDQLRQQVLARGTRSYAFRIVDPAVAAEKPVKPQRLLLTAAAAFTGLLLGLILGLLRQSRR